MFYIWINFKIREPGGKNMFDRNDEGPCPLPDVGGLIGDWAAAGAGAAEQQQATVAARSEPTTIHNTRQYRPDA